MSQRIDYSKASPEGNRAFANVYACVQNSSLPILVEAHLWSRLPAAFHANIAAAYIVLQAGANPSQAAE